MFGIFGDAYNTNQILYRASELIAAGVTPGQITSLTFNIARIAGNGGSPTSAVYDNIKIGMGCTNSTTLTTLLGVSDVYTSPSTVTLTSGNKTFFFDQAYNWDGVSNIVIQVCWYYPNGKSSSTQGSIYAFCDAEDPGYSSYRYSGTNFSPGTCATNDFVDYQNYRPRLTFGFCKPQASFNYTWSSPAGFNSTTQNPTVNPTTTTTYTVSVLQPELLQPVLLRQQYPLQ